MRNIIVMGGSAGSGRAISSVLRDLPADFPAAVFVVIHMDPSMESLLADRLADITRLEVISPQRKRSIREGRIYVARPDYHLVIAAGSVMSCRGPRENLWRPAIDVLFRSAAVEYTTRVIGVLMSGQLDDGTSGLQAIKACGGVTVVQDPADSLFEDMPKIAIVNAQIDHCVPGHEVAELLARLARETAPPSAPVPEPLREEVAIALGLENYASMTEHRGALSVLSCPECGGPLWQRGEDAEQFRCLTGHSFHALALLRGADEALDRTLWAAIRLFEQRAHVSKMMNRQEQTRGRSKRAALHAEQAVEAQQHAHALKELQLQRRAALQSERADEKPREDEESLEN